MQRCVSGGQLRGPPADKGAQPRSWPAAPHRAVEALWVAHIAARGLGLALWRWSHHLLFHGGQPRLLHRLLDDSRVLVSERQHTAISNPAMQGSMQRRCRGRGPRGWGPSWRANKCGTLFFWLTGNRGALRIAERPREPLRAGPAFDTEFWSILGVLAEVGSTCSPSCLRLQALGCRLSHHHPCHPMPWLYRQGSAAGCMQPW